MLNEFEKKIQDEYMKNHVLGFVEEATEMKLDLQNNVAIGEKEAQQAYGIHMQNSMLYRITYLALKSYHQALSEHLAEQNIVLPDIEELLTRI